MDCEVLVGNFWCICPLLYDSVSDTWLREHSMLQVEVGFCCGVVGGGVDCGVNVHDKRSRDSRSIFGIILRGFTAVESSIIVIDVHLVLFVFVVLVQFHGLRVFVVVTYDFHGILVIAEVLMEFRQQTACIANVDSNGSEEVRTYAMQKRSVSFFVGT